MKYKLKIDWFNEIEADSEEEALEIFWDNMFLNIETTESFLSNIIDVEEIK